MTEEIKEMLHCIEMNCKHNKCFGGIDEIECKLLLDYITNLQQDLEKANDIIEKDRQFYKCRMEEWLDYKSRIDKAIKFMEDTFVVDESDKCIAELYELLQGSDNNGF